MFSYGKKNYSGGTLSFGYGLTPVLFEMHGDVSNTRVTRLGNVFDWYYQLNDYIME